jgi:pimeloyl-ACP methyl ester carboxylesterase
MATPTPKNSTTVRTLVTLYALRLWFWLGARFWPQATLHRAATLFCTPLGSSRRRALEMPDTGAREEAIDVDGIRIATYVWGDPARQPYLLFAHGWSSHGTRVAPWVAPLQAAGYAVVAFDQMGHGRSGGERTTLPDFACCLLAVGHHYGPAAAVVGHSLGGAATAVALARGLAAERAILIAPAADPLAAMERFSRFVGLGTAFGRRLAALFERETRVPVDDLQAHRNAPMIGRPALIVHDLEDREVPWAEGERYARFWPGARMISTRGLGHNRIAAHPQVIEDALRFLRREPVGVAVVSTSALPFGLC